MLFAVISPILLCFVLLPHYPCAQLSPTSATESSPSPFSTLSPSPSSHLAAVSCSRCCSAKQGVLNSFNLGSPGGSSTSFKHFSESFFFLGPPYKFSSLAMISGPIDVVHRSCRAEPIPCASHLLLNMESSTAPICPWKTHLYLVFFLNPETLTQHSQMNDAYH